MRFPKLTSQSNIDAQQLRSRLQKQEAALPWGPLLFGLALFLALQILG